FLLQQDTLKLGDFGSCRSVYSKPPHTEYISTRWYRAPECLLTDGYYSLKMDVWSVGCVFFEIIRSRAMCFDFPPKKGSGISRLIPNCPAPALSLLYQMLAYDPDERISAQTALQHTYFREIRLAEKKSESLMRTIEAVEAAETGKKPHSIEHIWRPARIGR
ncbi:hypothetical protein CRUP_018789, partial [Coryphaenoides rupestris]